MGRHIAALAGERFGDTAALRERLRQIHGELDLDVTARNLEGRIVASAGAEQPPLTARDAAKVASGEVVVNPRPRWHTAAPIRDPHSGTVVGTVEVAARHRMTGPRLFGPALAVAAVLLIAAAAP